LFVAITVEPTWDVLYRGAAATENGQPLFPHRHITTRPTTVRNDQVWLAMLDLTEAARRYNQASRAVLDLDKRDGAGSNGPIGTGDLMLDGKGCENWREKSRATWPALVAGRREQRHTEPEIAAARDLADAYHYLDYYGPRLRRTRLPRQRPDRLRQLARRPLHRPARSPGPRPGRGPGALEAAV
jgi:hypothetical protein